MRRINLGILQANHDKSVEVGDAFPDDAHRFRDLFDDLDERFRYRVYMTIGGEVPTDIHEQDAFMITGSPLSVLDKHLFTDSLQDFIRRCDEARKPLMGACFGHQAIALALGGTVERSPNGYNVGIEETRFHDSRSWMTPAQDELPMYVFHEDQVTSLPDGCDLLGSTERCKISSFAKDNHIFTTQAHPEFTSPFMRTLLDVMEDKLDPETANKAFNSLAKTEEGNLFARWSANFFQGL